MPGIGAAITNGEKQAGFKYVFIRQLDNLDITLSLEMNKC